MLLHQEVKGSHGKFRDCGDAPGRAPEPYSCHHSTPACERRTPSFLLPQELDAGVDCWGLGPDPWVGTDAPSKHPQSSPYLIAQQCRVKAWEPDLTARGGAPGSDPSDRQSTTPTLPGATIKCWLLAFYRPHTYSHPHPTPLPWSLSPAHRPSGLDESTRTSGAAAASEAEDPTGLGVFWRVPPRTGRTRGGARAEKV